MENIRFSLEYLRNVKSRSIFAVVFRLSSHTSWPSWQFAILTFSNLPSFDPRNQRNRNKIYDFILYILYFVSFFLLDMLRCLLPQSP